MLIKTIKYEDYNGTEREEEFCFHLTKAELMEMQLSINGGLESLVRQIVMTQDTAKIIKIFKEIIIKSYGVKSLDGKRFIKDEEITKEFTQTEAYSQLFMELATDADKAAAFINGILPSDLKEEINAESVPELKALTSE